MQKKVWLFLGGMIVLIWAIFALIIYAHMQVIWTWKTIIVPVKSFYFTQDVDRLNLEYNISVFTWDMQTKYERWQRIYVIPKLKDNEVQWIQKIQNIQPESGIYFAAKVQYFNEMGRMPKKFPSVATLTGDTFQELHIDYLWADDFTIQPYQAELKQELKVIRPYQQKKLNNKNLKAKRKVADDGTVVISDILLK